MVSTPKIQGPDGLYREQTRFSTTLPNRFFQGQMDASTVDMQISIRGGAFTSDPDLILFEGTSFSFPNPEIYPEGLELVAGSNTVEVRSIGFSGAVSASAELEVLLIQENDTDLLGDAPSSLFVEQQSQAVTLVVQGVNDSRFVGVNFYASRFPGGGATGYQRVNLEVISDGFEEETTQTILQQNIDVSLQTDDNGELIADPMYIHFSQGEYSTQNVVENPEDINPQTEEEAAGAFEETVEGLLKTDFNQVVEVPETARKTRTNVSIDVVETVNYYTFLHDRRAGPSSTPPTVSIGEFASLSNDEPLYYVATALYYDTANQVEFESPFSTEVVAKPISIVQTLGTFPSPSRTQVVSDTLASLLRTEPDLAIQAGSVIRDTVVDPISDEIIRLRFLVDFMYRVQSFDTLLQIDGRNGSSTPVEQSAYKQSLQRVFDIQNSSDVQVIVDTAFEQLAARNGVFRENGARSKVIVTFFTSKQPSQTITIPLGTRVSSGSIFYLTTAYAEIPLANQASFFDPSSGLYSVDVSAQAEQAGKAGDVGVGQIRNLVSNIPGFSVINRSRAFGGKDRDTNLDLATKARAALAGVDSGTEQGIKTLTAKLAGVDGVRVVAAGDPLMQRDLLDGRHLGGKVDVWVKGESIGRVTDTFAFSYQTAENVQFEVIGKVLDLVFRARDVNLSTDNPLAEMLDRQDLGLGFRNATSGQYFDLTDYKVLDYRTIQLSSEVSQPAHTFGDVLLGDYRYVDATEFEMTRQPVQDILSVEGEITGEVSYELMRKQDPLDEGRSVKAGDTVKILPSSNGPSGLFIDITNEDHILFENYDEFLDFLGANPLSIRVFDETKTVEYRGPQDPSGVSDFVIVGGTTTTAAAIRRTQTSNIRSGQRVLVDYAHSENFTVEYETNFVVRAAQDSLDTSTNVTADVLVKAVVPVPVDITATVVIDVGGSTSAVDRRLRSNLNAALAALPQGGALRESDVIAILERTSGVSYVQTPLIQLARAADSIVVREELTNASSADTTLLLGTPSTPWSTATVRVWLFEEPLDSGTSDGGGSDANFRAVFQDEVALVLQRSSPSLLKESAGKAYIIGDQGLVIPGYSDDATIESKFPNASTPSEIEEARRSITQNRVMISTRADDQPLNHDYTCTYVVAETQNRVQSIELGDLEYFVPGNFLFNYVEDRRG